MKETFLVDCANCGHQVFIEDKTSICYWCHRSASKKEEIEAIQADNTSLSKVRRIGRKTT